MEPTRDPTPAGWLVATMTSFGGKVGDVTPPGFAAYARILHPAQVWVDDAVREVRWGTIARRNERVAHARMQWERIATSTSVTARTSTAPLVGGLIESVAARLAKVLKPHTDSPDRCYFALWDGWGGVKAAGASFEIPARTMNLSMGRLEEAPRAFGASPFFQSANLWWPTDRAWIVASEIDFDSTIVGGSRACIDALLGCPGVEAYEVERDFDLSSLGDTVNPPSR